MVGTSLLKKKAIVIAMMAAGILMISACSSGRKALQRGDYGKAVNQAVKRLRSDDDNVKAIAALKEAYPLALATHDKSITRAKTSPDPFKWERVVTEYRAINQLHDEIQRCPACLAHIPQPRLVTTELREARERAADNRYELASEALRQGRIRSKALEAHQHLLKADAFIPGYKDSEELLEKALHYATLYVVVEPVPAPSLSLQINHDFFNNKLNEHLRDLAISSYVCFYTPEEAEALDLEWIDHRVQMHFERFALGNVSLNTETVEVFRDSVLLDPKEDNRVYGRVSAKFTTNEKRVLSTGVLDFKIIDQELGKVVSQEKFPSEFQWSTKWATFNGDERALTAEQKKMVKQREIPIPDPQYMFVEFTAPLYDQVLRKIEVYYREH